MRPAIPLAYAVLSDLPWHLQVPTLTGLFSTPSSALEDRLATCYRVSPAVSRVLCLGLFPYFERLHLPQEKVLRRSYFLRAYLSENGLKFILIQECV